MLAHAFWLADLPLHIGPIRPKPFQSLFTSEALSRQSRTRDRPGASQSAHSLPTARTQAGLVRQAASKSEANLRVSKYRSRNIRQDIVLWIKERKTLACSSPIFNFFEPVLRASQGGA